MFRALLRPASLMTLALVAAPALAQDPADADGAAEKIRQIGGKVERDDQAEDKPVAVVNFATTQAADADLELVKGFPGLRKLTLNNTKVTDAGLDHLKGLEALEKLYLVDTAITDAGLDRLKDMEGLRILSLVGTQVTDAGLDHLKDMEGLQEVYLYGTKVTDEGVKALKEARPNLRIDR